MRAAKSYQSSLLTAATWILALGLLGCEGAPSASERLAAAGAAALNASPRISDFAIASAGSLRLQTGAVVNGGDIGARGTGAGPFLSGGVAIDVGTGVKTQTTRNIIAESVRLGSGAVVGDVQTSRLVDTSSKHGQVTGLAPLPSLPSASQVTPGTTNLTVATGKTVSAAPGRFANVAIATGATLRLATGTYEVAALSVATGARLEAAGGVQLRIAGRLSVDTGAFVGVTSGSPTSARGLVIEVSGINGTNGDLGATPKAASIGTGAQLIGLVLVPNGTLTLGSGVSATGALIARDVDVGTSSKVTFQDGFVATCNPAACDDHNPCTVDACSGGACMHAPVANGTSCDDGNGCTRGDGCSAGTCRGGESCGAQALCQGSGAGATCACLAGYAGDGFTCATHVASTIDPGAGGSVTVSDPQSPLDGTQVVLPQGSTAAPIVVSISESLAPAVEPPAEAVGPVIHLEPEGIVFALPVELTLPFNPGMLHAMHASAVSVLRLSNPAAGWVEIPITSIDFVAGTVTVLTNGFSDWVVVDSGNPQVPECIATQCGVATLVFDGAWTCVHSDAIDGTACDDGDGCTFGDACSHGSCVPVAGCEAQASCQGSGAGASCACNAGYVGNGASCALDEHFHIYSASWDGRQEVVSRIDGSEHPRVGVLGDLHTWTGVPVLSPDGLTLYALGSTGSDNGGVPEIDKIYSLDLTTGVSKAVLLARQLDYSAGEPVGVLDGQVLSVRTDAPNHRYLELVNPDTGVETQLLDLPQGLPLYQNSEFLDAERRRAYFGGTHATGEPNGFVFEIDLTTHQMREFPVPSYNVVIHGMTSTGLVVGSYQIQNGPTIVFTLESATGTVVSYPDLHSLGYYAPATHTFYTTGPEPPPASVPEGISIRSLAGSSDLPFVSAPSVARRTQGCSSQCISRSASHVPPCSIPNTVCDDNATCIPGAGESYSCTCNPGTEGNGETCSIIDVCSIDAYPCDHNADCVTTAPFTAACTCRYGFSGDGHTCTCAPGFGDPEDPGNGSACEPINPCTQHSRGGCDTNARCIYTGPGMAECECLTNYVGDGYSCTCPSGYFEPHPTSCVVDPCQTEPNGGCDVNATCERFGHMCRCNPPFVGDGITCSCQPGYRQVDNDCVEVIACQIGENGGCDPNALCIDTEPGERECVCQAPLVGDGFTCGCEPDYVLVDGSCEYSHACASGNGGCDQNADCIETGPLMRDCVCRSGYVGDGYTCDEE